MSKANRSLLRYPVITRATVRDGRFLACAVVRRYFRGKGEDSGV